ncbi:translation initiation factor IF3-1, mitochondrial [Prosopis cineraria]|uniref:translation initiation factor IF3-1, mitochondrial n=1 Tax=Prosopis cineraria TaxID=364024 RepID=UPI0024106183|nr:translation initiation factor IF3-1, mitochondrial [Prosopis cineraria]
MAYWCRIRQSKLKILSTQFRRCYVQLPGASLLNSITHRKTRVCERPSWIFQNRSTDVYYNARFFAAPVQAKTKKDNSEPRMNEEITDQFVRLVVDDGHSIVSRLEALQRARRLKLDLVEVQKNAKPPVCKIMDYHKEKYKQQEKEKERAKSKSELSLRNGVGKEMRFSAKAELKDLKMKADMVRKLMEKGYRVKCRALGGAVDQDMEGILSRFSALIEDVSVVESGPHMGKKEAYVIVRHIKFGLPKKGGVRGKKLQDAMDKSVEAEEVSDSDEDLNESPAETGFETEDEVLSDGDKHTALVMGRANSADDGTDAAHKAGLLSKSDSEPPAMFENRYRRNNQLSISQEQPTMTENRYKRNNIPSITQEHPAVTENRYKRPDSRMNNFPSTAQQPPVVTENRYKRTDPRISFQQKTSWDNSVSNSRGPEVRGAFKSAPSDLNQNRQAMPDSYAKTEAVKQAVTPGSRNPMPSFEDIRKGGIAHPSASNAPRSGYGIFSATKGLDTPDA